MNHLHKILNLFTKFYPQFSDVQINIIPYNNLYIAKCMCEKDGDFFVHKKNRLINIIPTKIILTQKAMEQKENKLIFIFIHECAHGITPQVERKVKNKYIRIDHSRRFYNNFFTLLEIAHKNKLSDYKPKNIKELMQKDNRKENIKNDYKIHNPSQ